MQSKFLTISSPWNDPFRKAGFHIIFFMFKGMLGISLIEKKWKQMQKEASGDMEADPKALLDSFFRVMGIDWKVFASDFLDESFPEEGAGIVVANHAFGMLDGLILLRILLDIRQDVKIIVNGALRFAPCLQDFFIFVDPMKNTPQAKNAQGLKESLLALQQGNLLVTFPSGEVASYQRAKKKVLEPDWSTSIIKLSLKSKAPIIPIFFEGTHRKIFHILGYIHPRLRTIFLPKENMKLQNKTIRLAVGKRIPLSQLQSFSSPSTAAAWLKFKTYLLQTLIVDDEQNIVAAKQHATPIAKQQDVSLIAKEAERLTTTNKLVSVNNFSIFHFHKAESPVLMQEIARLREETFRLVGEGTGKSEDIDQFDDYYTHLVLWCHQSQEICGAYRFMPYDKHESRPLYTQNLFNLHEKFLPSIAPAIELGRSFITPKWQRKPQSLLLLWRGIAEWCFLHPQYERLFGMVSISPYYHTLSQELIQIYSQAHVWDDEFSSLVSPKTPSQIHAIKMIDDGLPDCLLADFSLLHNLVMQIEDGNDVPILFKHYLKIGSKLMCFNIDPDFNNCLDGLLYIDLKNMQPQHLKRFMGVEKAKAYQTWKNLPTNDKNRLKPGDILNQELHNQSA